MNQALEIEELHTVSDALKWVRQRNVMVNLENHRIAQEDKATRASLGHKLDELNAEIAEVILTIDRLSDQLLDLETQRSILSGDYNKA